MQRSTPRTAAAPPSHRVRHRLSEADQHELVARYEAGECMADLARRYGLSDYSVRRILAEAGVRPGAPGLTTSQIELIRELDGRGWSAAKIHRELGLSEAGIILCLRTAAQ